jgi:DNA-binding LacI/PurR family transcriptional regulator
MVAGIMDTAFLHGIAAMIVPLPLDDQESSAFDRYRREILPMLSGLIYLGESGSSHRKALDFLLSRKNLPQVFIGGKPFMEHLGTVELDLENAAKSGISTLAEMGHTSFALFGADIPRREKFQLQTIERFPVFKKEILSSFPLPGKNTFCGRYDSPEADQFLHQLLTSPHPPTVVICTGAYEARLVKEHAKRLGLRIPEDLSLVGFDIAPSEGIASLRYPYYQMGKSAFEIIMEARKRNLPVSELRKVLPLSLFLHDTIAPCNKYSTYKQQKG